ncbi:MAG: Uncharacterised protein [Crocinitomicaceae bacterium]|nr:MAG: Uncharacterised protein [Crocinitomicaceae bacterium]
MDGKFSFTSLLTVLVGILTRVVVNGLIIASPGSIIFPLNLPNVCLTPTSPGFTIAQELKRVEVISRTSNNFNVFIIQFFLYS